MYSIYVQNKPLLLVDWLNGEAEDLRHRRETIFIDELNSAAIKTMLHELEKDSVYAGVYLHENIEELLQAFKAHLTVVQAAGGLVHTPENRVLLIFRRGKWDLPKGKLDEGEDLATCAVREIEEETGLSSPEIERTLHITYHTYHEKGKHILKESHWYLMKTDKAVPLAPQTEEYIEQCEWVSLGDMQRYTSNMHASIIDVIRLGESALQKSGI